MIRPIGSFDDGSLASGLGGARGDGATYTVLLSTPSTMRSPARATFVATKAWTEVRIPLASFAGTARTEVSAFFFGAMKPGVLAFELDGVL